MKLEGVHWVSSEVRLTLFTHPFYNCFYENFANKRSSSPEFLEMVSYIAVLCPWQDHTRAVREDVFVDTKEGADMSVLEIQPKQGFMIESLRGGK